MDAIIQGELGHCAECGAYIGHWRKVVCELRRAKLFLRPLGGDGVRCVYCGEPMTAPNPRSANRTDRCP